jgi:hypothetical protein
MFNLDPASLAQKMDDELSSADSGRTRVYSSLEGRSWPVVAERTAKAYHTIKEYHKPMALGSI